MWLWSVACSLVWVCIHAGSCILWWRLFRFWICVKSIRFQWSGPWQWVIIRNSRGYIRIYVLCLENRDKPLIFVMQRKNYLKWSRRIPHCRDSKRLWSVGYFFTNLPKSLNMSCSKFSAPKIYLALRPWSQNRVHKLFLKSFDSGFLCYFNTTSPQMWQKQFGPF